MAITLFNAGNTSDLSSFYSFVQSKKEGTFLEDCTITLGEGNTSITFAKDDVSVSYNTSTTQGNAAISNYKVEEETKFTITASTANGGSTGYSRFASAIICNNALIITVYTACSYSSSTIYYTRYLTLTTDDSGNLAVICSRAKSNALTWREPNNNTASSIEEVVNCGYAAFSKDSIAVAVGWCRPTFGSQLTTLCPVALNTVDGDITLPNAFVMVNSQLAGEGLTAITIDGTDYATNGWWCFKD